MTWWQILAAWILVAFIVGPIVGRTLKRRAAELEDL